MSFWCFRSSESCSLRRKYQIPNLFSHATVQNSCPHSIIYPITHSKHQFSTQLCNQVHQTWFICEIDFFGPRWRTFGSRSPRWLAFGLRWPRWQTNIPPVLAEKTQKNQFKPQSLIEVRTTCRIIPGLKLGVRPRHKVRWGYCLI